MKFTELRKELGKGKIRPAYLLAGPEPLLRDDALALLREKVLGDGDPAFNFERLRVSGLTPSALGDALQVLPVFAERRLVVLADPDQARGNSGKNLLAALADEVAGRAEDDPVVLVVTSTKPDKRSRWVKAFGSDPATVVECEAPSGAKGIESFIVAEAREQGVEIEPAAAALLGDRIGPQMLVLRGEIAKASLLAGEGETVTRAHIESGSGLVAEQPVWDLTDAIGEGRLSEALVLLARIQKGGAAAPMVLGTLASHFRRLARVREGARVPGPPFVVKKLERQAGRFAAPRLRACLDAIHETDTAIKGAGSLPPNRALERLVMALAS